MTGSIHIKKDHAHFFLAPLLDRLYRQDRSTAYRSTNVWTNKSSNFAGMMVMTTICTTIPKQVVQLIYKSSLLGDPY